MPFDESNLSYLENIVEIKVRHGDLIDGIQVIYRSHEGAYHGGNGGRLSSIKLDNNERITTVSGTCLKSCGSIAISSLTFLTDYGQAMTFGKPLPGPDTSFIYDMCDGAHLAAIKGFDAYPGGGRSYPGWAGDFRLLPAIGFIAKY